MLGPNQQRHVRVITRQVVNGGYPFSSSRSARVDSATILPATVTRSLPSAGENVMGVGQEF